MIKVSCAIIISKQSILITKIVSKPGIPGKWEFPGGKIKENETASDAIIREIREELNLKVQVTGFLDPVHYSYSDKDIVLYPFYCSVLSGSVKLLVHQEYRWARVEELSETDFLEADKLLIEKIQKQICEK